MTGKTNFFYFILILIFPLHASQNFFGTVGNIYTPNARFYDEGTLSLSFSNNSSFTRGNLLAQPYDWLEVSIFYADIPDKPYYASIGQSYKDKGFNVKMKLFDEKKYSPQVALGLSDFAGTGLFSGEYIVASKAVNNFDLSLGIGWGIYGGFHNFKNPFISLDDSYASRNDNFDNVGDLDPDDYFSGEKASFFASFTYETGNGRFFLESGSIELSKKRFDTIEDSSEYHFGYKFKIFDTFDIVISGSDTKEFDFTIGVNENFSKISKLFT